ncbi:hypothetical protein [Nioella sp. MMSF_3534]|uniref:hypothetical protein n=1 Tax=Nioella sp. MMSF_3534 TaxID=3046720 RepID=UPI00273EA710|nr:hypothetical protein [Nioella sp. MMSF_3534]
MAEQIAEIRAAFMFFKEVLKSLALAIKTRTRIRHLNATLRHMGFCANREAHTIPTSTS